MKNKIAWTTFVMAALLAMGELHGDSFDAPARNLASQSAMPYLEKNQLARQPVAGAASDSLKPIEKALRDRHQSRAGLEEDQLLQ